MLNDAEVRKAAENFVTIIIRRPHAYEFRSKFAKNDDSIPIPGVAFLNTKAKLVGVSGLDDSKGLVEKMRLAGLKPGLDSASLPPCGGG